MGKLRIGDTTSVVAKFVTPAPALPSLDHERKAAAGIITAEERKAEGLADDNLVWGRWLLAAGVAALLLPDLRPATRRTKSSPVSRSAASTRTGCRSCRRACSTTAGSSTRTRRRWPA